VDTNEEAGTVSPIDGEKKQRRPRRSFTDEFKAEVVNRVLSRLPLRQLHFFSEWL